MINLPTGLYILLGKNKLWYAGIDMDLGYMMKLYQKIHGQTFDKSSNSFVYDNKRTNDFTNKEFVVFGGLEVGRTIKPTKWVNINISISAKYSSKINTDYIPQYPDAIISSPRTLMVSAINISFYPIFNSKRKK